MVGINRAKQKEDTPTLLEESRRFLKSYDKETIPCIFISYQRADEAYAREVANYIRSKQIDVYFDLDDIDLKFQNQSKNPKGVTEAITKGLNQSKYMLVIVSPSTVTSPWVPFEIGYAYDKKNNNLKLLRHKLINKSSLPGYMLVKELLNGTTSLNNYLDAIRRENKLNEIILSKGEQIIAFSSHVINPLNKYLDNE